MSRTRVVRLPVTFDREGYNPLTDQYAITCPACGARSWFTIRGGSWPHRCPICSHAWWWQGYSTGSNRAKRRIGIANGTR